jgi:Uma2 family endonuclease
MTAYTVKLESVLTMTDEQFYNLCWSNPDLKFERSATGDLIIMSPTGGETGNDNVEIAADVVFWNRSTKTGKVFDSSTGFKLPNGADRSPDVAWVSQTRWDALTPEQKAKFPPLCPDFVIELRSPSDDLKTLQAKMQEYIDNGTQLGWLIDRFDQRVFIYRLGQPIEVLQSPTTVSADPVLPGFVLQLAWATMT